MRRARRTARIALPAAAAIAILAACGARDAAPATPPLVVLIEVDTLRADALGCYGNGSRGEGGIEPSPSIDAFAREGVLFERAYSAAPWTIPSLASLFTGFWPWEHRALRLLEPLDERLPTLAERFRAAGWRTAGVSANFVVRAGYGFARGFELWDESHATGHEGSTAHAAVDALLAFADELAQEPGQGLFLYALVFEPHYRYEEQSGLRFGPAYEGHLTGSEDLPALLRERARLDPADIAFLRSRYQGEVARADEAFGRLLRELERRGMMSRALIALTADHGEEIMDRGWIGHARTLHEELVRVPLVLRLPAALPAGQRGMRVEHPVSQLDLGATLLELAGLEPELGDGLSFAGTVQDGELPRRRYLYLHTDFEPVLDSPEADSKRAHQWGVVDARERLKWIVDHRAEGGPAGSLFDLALDPSEVQELSRARAVPPNLVRLDALDPASGRTDARPLPVADEDQP